MLYSIKHYGSFLFLLLLMHFLLILAGCEQPNRLDMLKHKRVITEDRNKKNEFFKYSADSPVPDDKRWEFKKLNYFPVDIEFRVKADYQESDSLKEVKIQTSSGHPRDYVTVGSFSFLLNNQKMKLFAYQEKAWLEEDSNYSLFVPFTDDTTGKGTYGAGRYLDIEKPKMNQTFLDFNLAYNPYCVYNHNYSCPIPPPENHLAVSIRAGEKKYK